MRTFKIESISIWVHRLASEWNSERNWSLYCYLGVSLTLWLSDSQTDGCMNPPTNWSSSGETKRENLSSSNVGRCDFRLFWLDMIQLHLHFQASERIWQRLPDTRKWNSWNWRTFDSFATCKSRMSAQLWCNDTFWGQNRSEYSPWSLSQVWLGFRNFNVKLAIEICWAYSRFSGEFQLQLMFSPYRSAWKRNFFFASFMELSVYLTWCIIVLIWSLTFESNWQLSD